MNSQIHTLITLTAVANEDETRSVDRLVAWSQQLDEMESVTRANIARQRDMISAEAAALEREIVDRARSVQVF